MRARVSSFVILASCAVLGCKASASASLKTSGDIDGPDDEAPVTANLASAEAPGTLPDIALLGARHDLRYVGPATATCRCLAVTLGGVSDAGMAWRSQVPEVDPSSQLVIALSSEGVACPDAPKDGLGASYWGYRVAGEDVIVVVESARGGRPVTGGAIIPKPAGNGRVFVEPLAASVPYGKPLASGEKRCVLGNPGARRPTGPAVGPAAEEPDESVE
jgi:hypothetical protein